ncbi:hypothetical protein U9M48_000932 [Paspalum notatum var. saurae]|uniref:Wall-associated receptor kinase galacturonan-binding domain-containing protein n=1 Tax=Paspalum notatum var. saurae TaxID=547442 RepID=A0AAQ3SHR4_PASNO
MPSPNYYSQSHSHSHSHVVVTAVLWLCAAALAAPWTTGRTTTATGVGPPLPSPPSRKCLRWCGDVHIPYPFGAGPADSCSASSELRLYCNDTGNGVHKLFLGGWQQDCMECNATEVIDIDVIQGQMRVVSPIFYSCFTSDTTTSEGQSLVYTDLPEPYRFSSARNKFTVLGCSTATYMLGSAYDGNGYHKSTTTRRRAGTWPGARPIATLTAAA